MTNATITTCHCNTESEFHADYCQKLNGANVKCSISGNRAYWEIKRNMGQVETRKPSKCVACELVLSGHDFEHGH